MSLSPSAPGTRTTSKRRISTPNIDNVPINTTRTSIASYIREGRAIRRLVSLTDHVADLVVECDRRVMLEDNKDEVESVSSDMQERTVYDELVEWCPSVNKLLKSSNHGADVDMVCQALQKGADRARGSDAHTLKTSVAIWLNATDPHPVPPFDVWGKRKRGFNHNITGQLLCPVDYNWSDRFVRNAVKGSDSRYPVTAYMWPTFLYRNNLYNATHPSEGLFEGELLLRAFQCIFRSPSSAREISEDAGYRKAHKFFHTRRDVASLLKMRSVHPRAIAYTAVQLCFALSSCTSWSIQDDDFDYELFYNNIVNWFERPSSQAKARKVNELLRWWNSSTFGRNQPSALKPQGVEKLSVAISML